ncbi:KIF28 protein, partial [Polypterus senegalus]|nr:KIF28 protein [Polypterus senegalus]
MNSNITTIYDPRNAEHKKTFVFDYAYWSHSGFSRNEDGLFVPSEQSSRYADQTKVYNDLGKGMLDNALQGYNATLLAYGQTGSGKSYSMIGYRDNKGIIPNVCQELFKAIKENQDDNRQYQVIDLLSKSKSFVSLKVREDQHRGFYVEGLKSVPCKSHGQMERLMEQGIRTRTTASTNINASSSRSHMNITIRIKQIFSRENTTKQSNINLVDLAGSERQRSSGSEGDRLKEGTSVNLSLTTLGNVISCLADAAMGKKVVHIPYRESILTKLLQPALGGNSKTIMIATLSPADICFEESLSTLRYAERTKKIQNKAVINESPTERLIKELKADNAKLLQKLARMGHEGRKAENETKELRQLLTHNEMQIQAIQTLWEQHLQEALRDWEQQYALISQERRMMQTFPYILNINEDPQLSGVIKYFIQDGEWDIGLADRHPNAITVKGLGILDKHATFTNADRRVTLKPDAEARVIVNGGLIYNKIELRHLDRIILGSNSTFLYISFPCDRSDDDWSRYDYDFFQSEVARAEGFDLEKLGSTNQVDGTINPSILAVFHDYIKVMPMVAEANQMSHDLKKAMEFKLEVKNLAMSDSKGHDLEKEIIIKVTQKLSQQVWVWSKAKFINRKFLIEDLYQKHLEGADVNVDREKDPFWDPVVCIHLGRAHIWLQSLAFCIQLEEQVDVLNSEGAEEAILQVSLIPCTAAGQPLEEDDIIIEPTTMLGRRFDFQVHVIQCCGVKWLKENRERGIQIGYHMYDLPDAIYTTPVWHDLNPVLQHKTQFSTLSMSQDFLNYLQTNALLVDLWGLQEGCTPMASDQKTLAFTGDDSVIIDKTDLSGDTETQALQRPELHSKITKLEEELRLQRNINEILRKENAALKDYLRSIDSKKSANPNMDSANHSQCATQLPSTPKEATRKSNVRTSYDAEFAKALKIFYQSMNRVRGQLHSLLHHRLNEEDDGFQNLQRYSEEHRKKMKEFGDQLDACLNKLKQDVAAIVKKKREESGV